MENVQDKKKFFKSRSGISFTIISSFVLVLSIILALLTTCSKRIFDVEFNTVGGTPVQTQQVMKNSYVTEPTTEKLGYTLDKWLYNSKEWDFANDRVKEDMTLKAKWKLINYPIIYDYDGGTCEEGNPETYTVKDHFTFNKPTKEGYRFCWFLNNGGYKTLDLSAGTTGELHLLAIYTPNQYSVTSNVESIYGSVDGTGTYNFGAPVTLTITPKFGYKFVKWKNVESLGVSDPTQPTITFKMPARNVAAEAEFEGDTVHITYENLYGCTNPNPSEIEYKSSYEFKSLSGRNGYEFVKWQDEDENEITTMADINKLDITLTAVWNKLSYIISASCSGDGNGYTTGTGFYGYGDSCTLVGCASNKRFPIQFEGWYTTDGVLITHEREYTFTVTKSESFVAKFVLADKYIHSSLGKDDRIKQLHYSSLGNFNKIYQTSIYFDENFEIVSFSTFYETSGKVGTYVKEGNKITGITGQYEQLSEELGYHVEVGTFDQSISYDLEGRISSITRRNGSNIASTTTYSYEGNVVTMTTTKSSETIVVKETTTVDSTSNIKNVQKETSGEVNNHIMEETAYDLSSNDILSYRKYYVNTGKSDTDERYVNTYQNGKLVKTEGFNFAKGYDYITTITYNELGLRVHDHTETNTNLYSNRDIFYTYDDSDRLLTKFILESSPYVEDNPDARFYYFECMAVGFDADIDGYLSHGNKMIEYGNEIDVKKEIDNFYY